jgi:hypothetical protein
MYKEVPCFFDYYNQMLCIFLTRLHIGMYDHLTLLNFCKYRYKKIRPQWNDLMDKRKLLYIMCEGNPYMNHEPTPLSKVKMP